MDLERGTLRVMESLEQTKAGIRFKAPKTDRTRAITLPQFAINELHRLKKEQAEQLLTLAVRQSGETLVCCRADGLPLQPQSLTHEFTYLVSRVKDVPRICGTVTRRSFCSRAFIQRSPQERLGHSTISTKLDLYSHVTDTMQSDAAARLDAAFRPAMNRLNGSKLTASVAISVAVAFGHGDIDDNNQ